RDFLPVETLWLKRIYILFFISLERRRIELVASTTTPDGAWVTQQARNLLMALDDRHQRFRFLHLSAYTGIALGWFHQIPTGNDLVLDTVAADYWRALYVATLALLVGYRVLVPLANALRFRLRVAEVVAEGPGVVSLRITGRRLERLGARAGQFFVWRFLSRGRWWTAHPFSLSAAPDGR